MTGQKFPYQLVKADIQASCGISCRGLFSRLRCEIQERQVWGAGSFASPLNTWQNAEAAIARDCIKVRCCRIFAFRNQGDD